MFMPSLTGVPGANVAVVEVLVKASVVLAVVVVEANVVEVNTDDEEKDEDAAESVDMLVGCGEVDASVVACSA